MSERMTIHLNGRSVYDIVLETSFDRLGREAAPFVDGRKVCIVTDSNVAGLYLDEVAEIFSACSRHVTRFIFPAGEEHKNLNTVQNLYETLILEKFDRRDILVALGGGVVGDLCGFTAATYLRGVDFIPPPCSPRWTAASEERPAWISSPTRTWWGHFTCPAWCTATWLCWEPSPRSSIPPAWARW